MIIRPADLLAQIESRHSPTIVDVRSREEYVAGHVPGAMHIPFWATGWRAAEVHLATADRLRGKTPGESGPQHGVVVYCGHGPRAWMAGALFGLRGFRNLIYLEGHWAEWQRQGLREETGERS